MSLYRSYNAIIYKIKDWKVLILEYLFTLLRVLYLSFQMKTCIFTLVFVTKVSYSTFP